jgi:hypothetical protein
MRRFLVVFTLALFAVGCSPLEQNARDVSAAAQGYIDQAQSIHQTECVANPSLSVCQIINRAVDAQNALVDAVESYCGWPTRPTDQELAVATANCQKISTAQAALSTAVRNVDNLMGDLRGAAGKVAVK